MRGKERLDRLWRVALGVNRYGDNLDFARYVETSASAKPSWPLGADRLDRGRADTRPVASIS